MWYFVLVYLQSCLYELSLPHQHDSCSYVAECYDGEECWVSLPICWLSEFVFHSLSSIRLVFFKNSLCPGMILLFVFLCLLFHSHSDVSISFLSLCPWIVSWVGINSLFAFLNMMEHIMGISCPYLCPLLFIWSQIFFGPSTDSLLFLPQISTAFLGFSA